MNFLLQKKKKSPLGTEEKETKQFEQKDKDNPRLRLRSEFKNQLLSGGQW